jgi:hypothetical protein
MAAVGIPNEWFTSAERKAEIVKLPRGANWPYLTVFYRNGEFSHVRLYVHALRTHSTWSVLPNNIDIESYFNQETLVLEL